MGEKGQRGGTPDRAVPPRRHTAGVSRRTFIQGVSTAGAATAVLAGASQQAAAQYGRAAVDELSVEQLTAMYTDMVKIRLWETKVKDLILQGGFRGVAHPYVGQEAVAVGVCRALRQDDYIASNHRGHGHLIAKGGDLGRMLAEITHKAAGYCRGYGGSLHITDVGLGILGMNGIVGASHLFAAGAAYGIKVKKTDQVAVSFGGDGSLQNSFFNSAANAAAAWKLPWIAVIENNGFQIWVRAADVYGLTDLARRADGYGIEGRVVDGNDVLAVYQTAKYAADKARAGAGPTVIECKTYRWYDHYGVSGAKIGVDGSFGLGYRSDRELRDWMAKDPIRRFRQFLVSERLLTEEKAEQIVGGALGMAMTGVPAIAHIPSMATFIPFELMFNHAGKLRHMTGGQASFPMVLWADMARRDPYQGGQHADAGLESAYARLAGLKVVIPSTPYDAKGLMVSAIRNVDPVVFCHYSMPAAGPEVPDEPYTVPIGEAAVRSEGKDLTIVGYAPQTAEIAKAVEQLKQDGISAEFIDPRTLAPLEGVMGPIVASVKKTGRLLTADEGSYSFCNGAEIIARVAEAVPGVKIKRLAFPDAPAPGAPEMIQYMKADAAKIAAAARNLVKA